MPDFANARWIGVAILVMDLVALGTIWSSQRHSTRAKVVWTAIVIVLPVIGALAWALLGHERRHR